MLAKWTEGVTILAFGWKQGWGQTKSGWSSVPSQVDVSGIATKVVVGVAYFEAKGPNIFLKFRERIAGCKDGLEASERDTKAAPRVLLPDNASAKLVP